MWTLIYNGKLANQIARLVATVVKKKKLLKGHVTRDNVRSRFSIQQASVENYVCYTSRFSNYSASSLLVFEQRQEHGNDDNIS